MRPFCQMGESRLNTLAYIW